MTGVFAGEWVDCVARNASGTPLAGLSAAATFGANSRQNVALLFDTPVRICGTVTVDSAAWGPATATSCASVLPGNPKA